MLQEEEVFRLPWGWQEWIKCMFVKHMCSCRRAMTFDLQLLHLFTWSGHCVTNSTTVPPIEPYVKIYGGSWRSATNCHFASLLLWISIEYAYCVAIMLLCLYVFFYFNTWIFFFCFYAFYWWCVCCCFCAGYNYLDKRYFTPFCNDVIDKRMVFRILYGEGFFIKSIITICRFYKLYDEFQGGLLVGGCCMSGLLCIVCQV